MMNLVNNQNQRTFNLIKHVQKNFNNFFSKKLKNYN